MISNAKHSIVRAAGIVALFGLFSKLLGMYRDRLLASNFGAGNVLDAYYAAFRIPDLIYNFLILGTLSVAFIPVFTEYFVKDPREANRIANTILNAAFVGMGAVCAVLLFFVPEITRAIAPGFHGAKLQNTIVLTRLFLFSPVIFAVSSVFSSILNALKRFLLVSLAPIIYNIGIIFGIVFLYPIFGIRGLAYGVLLGALGHALVQVPGIFRAGFKYKPVLQWRHAGVIQIAKLFVPRIFGIDASQISLLIASVIGSTLAAGSIAVFNLANNLQAVPIGIFGLSFAIASFPNLSEKFALKKHGEFNAILRKTAVHILYFTIPISVLILLLRAQIVRVILGTGHFNWTATVLTANSLGIFGISIFAQSLIPLLARAFYARHNTKIPVLIGLGAMAANAILAWFLGRAYGVVGLAWAFSAASIFNMLALYFILISKLKGTPPARGWWPAILKICFAAGLMGLAVHYILIPLAFLFPLRSTIHVFAQGLFAALIGVAVFLGVSKALGIEETAWVVKVIRNRIFGGGSGLGPNPERD